MSEYDGHTIDVGYVHVLTEPDGPCVENCPHPSHPSHNIPPDDALALLAEWYDWWIETPGAPEKMPNALHVRTALLLTRPPA